MRKMILAAAAFFLLASASVSADAQGTDKKETEKTTTSDAWRQAIPEAEQTSDVPLAVIFGESTERVEARETPQQIEKRILELEGRLTEAFKKGDSATLKYLLADEFVPAGAGAGESQPDKTRFIEWALKNPEVKSYDLQKTKVRVFPTTAVVTLYYKQQTTVGGAPSESNFVATDVWVRRGKIWQAVSRHVSQLAK